MKRSQCIGQQWAPLQNNTILCVLKSSKEKFICCCFGVFGHALELFYLIVFEFYCSYDFNVCLNNQDDSTVLLSIQSSCRAWNRVFICVPVCFVFSHRVVIRKESWMYSCQFSFSIISSIIVPWDIQLLEHISPPYWVKTVLRLFYNSLSSIFLL